MREVLVQGATGEEHLVTDINLEGEEHILSYDELGSFSLDELQEAAEKLVSLLKDRELGPPAWNMFLRIRLENLHRLTSAALGK